jgi:macrolide-specific efflux system membrane fusion protein
MMALLTRPRTWIITAVVVVVVAGAAVWWFGFAHKTDANAAPATSTTLTVSTRTLQQSVSGTGTLSPTVDQQVNFLASGTVTAVNVQAGQTVKAGDTLATITTAQADADLAEAQATLASDQAKLASDQAASTGSSSDVAQIAADQAAVTAAQASVTSAQNAVNGTTLTAPVAGLVTAVNVAVGDSVTGTASSGSSGASSGSGTGSGSSGSGSGSGSRSGSTSTPSASSSSGSGSSSSSSSGAFEITGTDSWTTQISVAAAQVKNLKTGDQVTLSTTENPSFFGTVSSIGLLPSTSSGAATYPVDVKVTGTPDNLYDGVSVTADVIYKKVTDAVAVPSLAVSQTDGKSTVTKLENGKQVQQTVTTGIQDGQYVQITDGLKSGDQIVLKVAQRAPGGTGTGGTTGNRGRTGTGGIGSGGFPGGSEFGGGTGGSGFGGRGFGGSGSGGSGGGTGTTGSFQRPSGAGN